MLLRFQKHFFFKLSYANWQKKGNIPIYHCFLKKPLILFLFEYHEKVFLKTIKPKKQAAVHHTLLINDLHKIIIESGFN